jgi:hypothetical protein
MRPAGVGDAADQKRSGDNPITGFEPARMLRARASTFGNSFAK